MPATKRPASAMATAPTKARKGAAAKVSKRPASVSAAKRLAVCGGAMGGYEVHYPPANAKALVFDCDGTIVDTMPLHLQAWLDMSNKYKFPYSTAKFLENAGRAEVDSLKDIFAENGLRAIDYDSAVAYKGKVYRRLMKATPAKAIKPVVACILEGARRGLPMAVVSGSFHEDVVLALEGAGMMRYFSVVIGREDYCNGKPDPEPYLLGAEQLGVKPSRCVGYEDAAKAGIASIKAAGYMKAEYVQKFKDYPKL